MSTPTSASSRKVLLGLGQHLFDAATRIYTFRPLRQSLPGSRTFLAAMYALMTLGIAFGLELAKVWQAPLMAVTGMLAISFLVAITFGGRVEAALQRSALPVWNVCALAYVAHSWLISLISVLGLPGQPLGLLVSVWGGVAAYRVAAAEHKKLGARARGE